MLLDFTYLVTYQAIFKLEVLQTCAYFSTLYNYYHIIYNTPLHARDSLVMPITGLCGHINAMMYLKYFYYETFSVHAELYCTGRQISVTIIQLDFENTTESYNTNLTEFWSL
jgi:hypothetical protein